MKSLSCKSCPSKKGDGCGLTLGTDLLNRTQKAVHTETVGEYFFQKKRHQMKRKKYLQINFFMVIENV